MKVCKFGGSSLANAVQIKKVKNIILSDSERKYIVVSAPGKSNEHDDKVTDLLLRYTDGEDTKDKIIRRFGAIAYELGIGKTFMSEVENIFSHTDDKDYFISRGEYLCAILLSEYIGFDFVDAKDIISFSGSALDEEKTKINALNMASKHKNAVIGGFYGSDNGKIKLFERGGSDISGAILAQKLCADVYENWTDVDGVMSASPRVVKKPHVISVITYRELRELCCMGATVLHEDALIPMRRAKIPVNIRNTDNPQSHGTMIVNSRVKPSGYGIIGVSGNKNGNICVVSESIGSALPKILSALGDKYISIEKPDSDTVLYIKVHENDVNDVINSIYSAFFRQVRD